MAPSRKWFHLYILRHPKYLYKLLKKSVFMQIIRTEPVEFYCLSSSHLSLCTLRNWEVCGFIKRTPSPMTGNTGARRAGRLPFQPVCRNGSGDGDGDTTLHPSRAFSHMLLKHKRSLPTPQWVGIAVLFSSKYLFTLWTGKLRPWECKWIDKSVMDAAGQRQLMFSSPCGVSHLPKARAVYFVSSVPRAVWGKYA